MSTELLMQDEGRAGPAEDRVLERKDSILEFLDDIGAVPDELRDRIMEENDMDKLKEWMKLVVRVNSWSSLSKRSKGIYCKYGIS